MALLAVLNWFLKTKLGILL